MVYNPGDNAQPPIIPSAPPAYPPPTPPPYGGWTPPPAPPRKRHTGLIVALVILAAVVLLGGGAALAVGLSRSGPAAAHPSPSWTPIDWGHQTAAAPVAKVAPDPKGFTVNVKILRKACFGSAGCNITFRVDPSYTGAAFTRGTSWEVVYQVNGGKDAYTNRFTLTGSQASFESEELIQTTSSSATLTAVVVDVVEA